MKVLVKIDSPLLPGNQVKDLVGNTVWISFKYEKLADFCYRCGRLDHKLQSCKEKIRKDEALERKATNSFGAWMRATLRVGREIPGGKIKRAAVYEEELVDGHNQGEATTETSDVVPVAVPADGGEINLEDGIPSPQA
ncbi:hypothetical protein Tsubulata_037185 [Turnera subulata]|uniref:Zinc knuckle CX2CX4HX4C domain-containing protein n=1 Tax=Turnera subulata TaxID=218843 RepID=A0A9Q0G2J2_9ROSI|nr:hypothetical protein Tsubulata_037185 [Turnera subulata]